MNEGNKMSLDGLYSEFDRITGYFFSKYSKNSPFGFNVLALDKILSRKQEYDPNKSLKDNLSIIHGDRAATIVSEILRLERKREK